MYYPAEIDLPGRARVASLSAETVRSFGLSLICRDCLGQADRVSAICQGAAKSYRFSRERRVRARGGAGAKPAGGTDASRQVGAASYSPSRARKSSRTALSSDLRSATSSCSSEMLFTNCFTSLALARSEATEMLDR